MQQEIPSTPALAVFWGLGVLQSIGSRLESWLNVRLIEARATVYHAAVSVWVAVRATEYVSTDSTLTTAGRTLGRVSHGQAAAFARFDTTLE